ncbi:hypothetical protein [Paenibacillus sp. ISL-20]|uniref:hypothetical protein n=1 Tax=Paenibacillus sp. ISL-20 TaxID=2819163 RepID=UPI001BEB2600|nr:hypothetical protein [Paenibacillus sp. ISL-20]MBT2759878.1 hypothetical protein [Paenibacillus sp. ISL-20]
MVYIKITKASGAVLTEEISSEINKKDTVRNAIHRAKEIYNGEAFCNIIYGTVKYVHVISNGETVYRISKTGSKKFEVAV